MSDQITVWIILLRQKCTRWEYIINFCLMILISSSGSYEKIWARIQLKNQFKILILFRVYNFRSFINNLYIEYVWTSITLDLQSKHHPSILVTTKMDFSSQMNNMIKYRSIWMLKLLKYNIKSVCNPIIHCLCFSFLANFIFW